MEFFLVVWMTKLYPYWVIPVLITLVEVILFFRRRKQFKKIQYLLIFLILILGINLFFWFYYQGYKKSESWVRSFYDFKNNIHFP